jgi:tocopherol cyclase
MRNPLVDRYRRTGADIPFGNPLPSHGTEMEGWFWRVSDEASGHVLIALCSVNRHPDGDWSTTAVGVHPGGVVRSAALSGARAENAPFRVTAGDDAGTFTVGADRVRFELGDLTLSMEFADRVLWPKAFGGGGVFSAIPFLNQYWHPYYLGGRASGTVEYAGPAFRCVGGGVRHMTSAMPTSVSRSPAACCRWARSRAMSTVWWSGSARR